MGFKYRYHEIALYGRTKKELLKIWNNQCVICGLQKNLEVHHIDGKGSSYFGKKLFKKEKNNDLNNLVILCRDCHRKIDGWKHYFLQGWSLRFTKCLVCETTKRKHLAKGLCSRCYEKTRKQYKANWYKLKSNLL